MTKILITFALTILFNLQLFAQVAHSAKRTKEINTYLLDLEKVGFSGAVLVELNGNKVISKGYGFSDKANSIKNTPSTIFDIGSITKQFTAAAILKLEIQGKLSTNDKITRYFDSIPIDKSAITIHDLLRHQSGLQSTVGGDYDKITKSDFIDLVMNSKLIFKSGTQFSYSNIGYSLLAIIIEKASDTSYEKYLSQNLWEPAKMEMTGYIRPKFDATQIAIGYFRDGKVWGKPNEKGWDQDAPFWNLKGNGGILSTADDLYKWHKALIEDQILSKEAKSKLYHPKIRAEENNNAIYAYGWDVAKTSRNTFRVWHNGTNTIFYADFMRYIDENVTLIMLSNKSNPNFDNLNFELSKIIFDKNYKPTIPVADNETNQIFSQEIIETILSKGLENAKLKYNSKPSKTDILENILNAKGYELLSQNKYDEAIGIFTMNVLAYPKSPNAFDSLGEAYLDKGNKLSAIKYYERSLELDPNNGNAKDILQELRK